MHAAKWHVHGDQFDAQTVQQPSNLLDGGVIGAQAAPDDGVVLVEPHQVCALETGVAGKGCQDGNAQRGESACDGALFAGTHRGRRACQNRALGCHGHQVGTKHQVG